MNNLIKYLFSSTLILGIVTFAQGQIPNDFGAEEIAQSPSSRIINETLYNSDTTENIESKNIIDENNNADVEIKPIYLYPFDTSLIPCHDLYSCFWDSLSVDLPKADLNNYLGNQLNLVESDCQFHHPILGKINSEFGWRRYRMHEGIDIDLNTGDPIYASFDGIIRISKFNPGGYGNYVLIRHYNGLETLYGHLSESFVFPNQTVKAGDIIGLGGSTGRSSGPHLHYELRFRSVAINPRKIIDFETGELKSTDLYLESSIFQPDWNLSKTYHQKQARKRAVYHTVRSGNTLSGIATKYGTTVTTLCRLNGIKRTSILRIGQKIRIR